MHHYGNSLDLGDHLEGSWATQESLDHSKPLLQAASLQRAAFVDNLDSWPGTFIGVFWGARMRPPCPGPLEMRLPQLIWGLVRRMRSWHCQLPTGSPAGFILGTFRKGKSSDSRNYWSQHQCWSCFPGALGCGMEAHGQCVLISGLHSIADMAQGP